MSAKTKIDGSEKTWSDGYICAQRVNFGGKADVTNMKNLVSFKTSNAAKVKVYWVEGGADNRQIAIFDSKGGVVTKTEVTAAKNEAVVSTLELADEEHITLVVLRITIISSRLKLRRQHRLKSQLLRNTNLMVLSLRRQQESLQMDRLLQQEQIMHLHYI